MSILENEEDYKMDLHDVANEAMNFVERYWAYYDQDWGRTRCHFCGHSDTHNGREHIEHAEDCRYIRLKEAWKKLESEREGTFE